MYENGDLLQYAESVRQHHHSYFRQPYLIYGKLIKPKKR